MEVWEDSETAIYAQVSGEDNTDGFKVIWFTKTATDHVLLQSNPIG